MFYIQTHLNDNDQTRLPEANDHVPSAQYLIHTFSLISLVRREKNAATQPNRERKRIAFAMYIVCLIDAAQKRRLRMIVAQMKTVIFAFILCTMCVYAVCECARAFVGDYLFAIFIMLCCVVSGVSFIHSIHSYILNKNMVRITR